MNEQKATNEHNDSYLEMALKLMKKKRKPQSLDAITKEVFQKRGFKGTEQEVAQFQLDFMLCGHFICCGEDKDNTHLWDLKSRQPSSLLDKDGGYLEDYYADDEDVINNELKDEYAEVISEQFYEEDDDDTDEQDDIAEELGMVTVDEDGESISEEISSEELDEEIDDEEIEDDDDIDEEFDN